MNTSYIWSFLLFTGYLKPIRVYKEKDNLTYFQGVIPNIEVQTVYQTTITQWFDERVNAASRTDLFDAIVNGNVHQMEEVICDWLESTISYYDSKESYYHGFMSRLLTSSHI